MNRPTVFQHVLDSAQKQGMCAHPTTVAQRQAASRGVRRGELVRPHRSLYARKSYWDVLQKDQQHLHIVRALQKLHPTWAFCHESAALVWGLPVSFDELDRVHVCCSDRDRSSSDGPIAWHTVIDTDIVVHRGIRVTTCLVTAFNRMRNVSFVEGLPTADGLCRLENRSAREACRAMARACSHRQGIRRAIGILAYADARSESWAESRARALIITQGFAMPRLQVSHVRPSNSTRMFRVDFEWTLPDERRVIGEVDGYLKYTNGKLLGTKTAIHALADEQHREAELTLLGASVLRLSYKDLMDTKRFVEKLELYDIPRSDKIAPRRSRMATLCPGSALFFHVITFKQATDALSGWETRQSECPSEENDEGRGRIEAA